jgi:hypothetical protein
VFGLVAGGTCWDHVNRYMACEARTTLTKAKVCAWVWGGGGGAGGLGGGGVSKQGVKGLCVPAAVSGDNTGSN